MSRSSHIPTNRLHKQSGQAIVTLPDGLGNRRDVLLGPHGSPESRQEYTRVISEWEASGHRIPQTETHAADLTINDVLIAYWTFAEGYYRKNDRPTAQLVRIRSSLRPMHHRTPRVVTGQHQLLQSAKSTHRVRFVRC
jgi:hypothetical protein